MQRMIDMHEWAEICVAHHPQWDETTGLWRSSVCDLYWEYDYKHRMYSRVSPEKLAELQMIEDPHGQD